jgi:hypothetical protein
MAHANERVLDELRTRIARIEHAGRRLAASCRSAFARLTRACRRGAWRAARSTK